MTTFTWLHLTDLHLGMDKLHRWPNIEEEFVEALDYLIEQLGPRDLVVFTGDLVQRGTEQEFQQVDQLFERLWEQFEGWRCQPQQRVAPGPLLRIPQLVRPAIQRPRLGKHSRQDEWLAPTVALT